MSADSGLLVPVPELHDIVAAIGSEHKALLLGSLVLERQYTPADAQHLLLDIQGEDPVWAFSRYGAAEFISDTFARIGLVTKATTVANNRDAYELTARGDEIGIPLAGHLLQMPYNGGPALIAYFGPASAQTDLGIRNSERRTRMMRIMLQHDGAPLRLVDLAQLMHMEPQHVGQVSDDLATSKLVHKEVYGGGKPLVEFSAAPSLATHHMRSHASPVSRAILEVLQQYFAENPDGRITMPDIFDRLTQREAYKNADAHHLRQAIQATVWSLGNRRAQAQLIAHDLVPEDTGRQPVWADAEQLEHMHNVITILDRTNAAREVAYRNEGREFAHELKGDMQASRILLGKAHDSSIALKGTPEGREQIRGDIVAALTASSGQMSARAMQEMLSGQGHALEIATVRNHLNYLTSVGILVKSEQTGGSLYAVAPENDKTS